MGVIAGTSFFYFPIVVTIQDLFGVWRGFSKTDTNTDTMA